MKNDIELFYNIKNLFNTPDEVFKIYADINNRLYRNREYEFGKNILLVFPTKECKKREYKKCLSKTYCKRNDDISIIDLNRNSTYTFCDITDISKIIIGRRFTDIRFIG